MALQSLLTGILCEVFLWQSGTQVANITTPAQTMHGIGASGAWWPIDLYNYPDSVRTNVSQLLFSNESLGLTSYRYNVGGGGVYVGTPSRAPETTYVSSGVYNFSADPQGSYFLRQASQYGVHVLTAFVNSAPPALTTNGRSCGGQIVDDEINAYAEYLAAVVGYWKTQGVQFTHVSPMNEPDSDFSDSPNTPCGQEGMIVNTTQRGLVVNALRSALDSASLNNVLVMADESASALQFSIEGSAWISSAEGSLGVLSHHDYLFSPDSVVAQMGTLARSLSGGKNTWFTEICCYLADDGSSNPAANLTYGANYDPTIVSALQMGNLLFQSFTQTLDTHFDWWTALSSSIGCDPSSDESCATSVNKAGYNDGLIYYDPNYAANGNNAIYLTKRYWVLKHFARAIPIGAVRYDVESTNSDFRVLAFQLSSSWSVIVMNLASSDEIFYLSAFNLGTPTAVYQTSAAEDWTSPSLSDTTACGDVFQMTIPAASITSLFFPSA